MKNVYVIVVTYNAMMWIEECLTSLYSSSLPINVIVVDNNSSDNSVSFIKSKFPNVNLLEQKNNLGFGKANNLGIKEAYVSGAEYFFLLNQDARVATNTIKKLVEAHQKEPEFGIVSPMHLNGKGDALDYKFSKFIEPSKCKKIYSDIYLNTIQDKIYDTEFVNAAAWLISKKCIETVGGFSPSFFHYGEDINYVQRVVFHQLKVGVFPNCIVFHDRENRLKNDFFGVKREVYLREIILKMSNPLIVNSFYTEYFKLYKLILKSLFFLRMNEFKEILSKINILNQINKEKVFNNLNDSKTVKPSFLE